MTDIIDNAFFFVFNRNGERRVVNYADYQTYIASNEWYKTSDEARVEGEKEKTRKKLAAEIEAKKLQTTAQKLEENLEQENHKKDEKKDEKKKVILKSHFVQPQEDSKHEKDLSSLSQEHGRK